MAWDPFNVTEDADLGTRLGRNKYRCQVLEFDDLRGGAAASRQLVPAAYALDQGLYADLARAYAAPAKLWRELGPAGFLGFQIAVAGTVLSALAHPWFYALAVFDLTRGAFLALPGGWLGLPFWMIAVLGLGTGYLASMTLGFLALKRRGARELFVQVPLMPVYWLLISGAAYRAAWQFVTDRFNWEKIEHGLSQVSSQS